MKLSLAPIQSMTVANYRNLYAEIFGGIDDYYSPFIATTDPQKSSLVLFKDIFPEANDEKINLIPQLLGNNGEHFRHYASTIVDMGYKEINWNIGCPFPMVTKKLKGSGILPHPDMVRSFLDEVCKDDNYNLTVKLRLGLLEKSEGIQIIDILNDYPLHKVILHGRTGSQKYAGTVDLDAFNLLYSACKHEMIYNGDIFCVEDYERISARFPDIEEFMLGRGALRDPFLPSMIKGNNLTNPEKLQKIRQFHDAMFGHYKEKLSGDRHVLDKMKEFWMYLSVYIDPTNKFMKKVRKSKSVDAYMHAMNEMLGSISTWRGQA